MNNVPKETGYTTKMLVDIIQYIVNSPYENVAVEIYCANTHLAEQLTHKVTNALDALGIIRKYLIFQNQ